MKQTFDPRYEVRSKSTERLIEELDEEEKRCDEVREKGYAFLGSSQNRREN